MMAASSLIKIVGAFVILAVITDGYPYMWDDGDMDEIKRAIENMELERAYDDDTRYLPQSLGYNRFYDEQQTADNLGVLDVVEDWPKTYVSLSAGQIGGVAVDGDQNVHVFHRGNRIWEQDTFDENNKFTKTDDGPIAQDTILILDKGTGKVLKRMGKNQFYLPHGITLDHHGNYWVTDVAKHQVIKMDGETNEVKLEIGKAFEPGTSDDDTDRLCKPTDVAISESGHVFIADGYCNHRVLKLDSNGTVVDKIVDPSFQVVHSLALAENLDLLCVADRDNGRILCYKAGLEDPSEFGKLDRIYDDPVLGRVFGITYSPEEKFLYAITESPEETDMSRGFTIDLAERNNGYDVVAAWAPERQMGFSQAHDIDVSMDGQVAYVGTVAADNSKKMWKFEQN